MTKYKILDKLLFISFFVFAHLSVFSQITSTADGVVQTRYTSGTQDNIYIFCGQKGDIKGTLTASYPAGESGNFEWQKYNSSTGLFDFFSSDMAGGSSSTISNLEDGCYRVKLTTVAGDVFYRAWVFNNYIEVTGQVTESDCFSFTLSGAFEAPMLAYTDLSNGQPLQVAKNIEVTWSTGSTTVSHVLTSRVSDPPTKDTEYKLEVTDGLECTGTATVTYTSIVTKASFTVSESEGEAPLEVTFTNASENGDAGKYEWFIFKDRKQILAEKEAGTFKDSIMDMLYNDNPVYTFENSGEYKVKLVSKKVSESTTCIDTFYLSGYIVADTSFIDAPNVFTPNGDNANDNFVVKYHSMQSMRILIFNRWGKLLHRWESNEVRGFNNTTSTVTQSVWDGNVGGRPASPGVYYYVAEGVGRDGEKRKANGFFHLFR